MCHEAGQSAFLHTLFYLSTNLDHILFSTWITRGQGSKGQEKESSGSFLGVAVAIQVTVCSEPLKVEWR